MYHEYTQEELRAYCRTNIETLEIWGRRLIHEKMTSEYGENYIKLMISEDEYLVNKELRKHVEFMMEQEPGRFNKAVDTLFLDDIIYFLCNQKWYKKLFKQALDYIYPQGKDEAREFLKRLVYIRNYLSHSNPISVRQVEQVICYTHDFIDGLKQYYKDRGEEQVWNVPRIIKIKDSFGNVFDNPVDTHGSGSIFTINNAINCGDTYSIEIEVDSSFKTEDYNISWTFNSHDLHEYDDKTKLTVTFLPSDVDLNAFIRCKIVSKEEWHKHGSYDNRIAIGFSVLPPIK